MKHFETFYAQAAVPEWNDYYISVRRLERRAEQMMADFSYDWLCSEFGRHVAQMSIEVALFVQRPERIALELLQEMFDGGVFESVARRTRVYLELKVIQVSLRICPLLELDVVMESSSLKSSDESVSSELKTEFNSGESSNVTEIQHENSSDNQQQHKAKETILAELECFILPKHTQKMLREQQWIPQESPKALFSTLDSQIVAISPVFLSKVVTCEMLQLNLRSQPALLQQNDTEEDPDVDVVMNSVRMFQRSNRREEAGNNNLLLIIAFEPTNGLGVFIPFKALKESNCLIVAKLDETLESPEGVPVSFDECRLDDSDHSVCLAEESLIQTRLCLSEELKRHCRTILQQFIDVSDAYDDVSQFLTSEVRHASIHYARQASLAASSAVACVDAAHRIEMLHDRQRIHYALSFQRTYALLEVLQQFCEYNLMAFIKVIRTIEQKYRHAIHGCDGASTLLPFAIKRLSRFHLLRASLVAAYRKSFTATGDHTDAVQQLRNMAVSFVPANALDSDDHSDNSDDFTEVSTDSLTSNQSVTFTHLDSKYKLEIIESPMSILLSLLAAVIFTVMMLLASAICFFQWSSRDPIRRNSASWWHITTTFAFLAMPTCFAMDVLIWQRVGVNFAFMFSLKLWNHWSGLELLRNMSHYWAVWSVFIYAFCARVLSEMHALDNGNSIVAIAWIIPFLIWPSLLLLFILRQTWLHPVDRPHWFLYRFGRLLLTPFFPVTFSEFFICTMLVSLSTTLYHLQLFWCELPSPFSQTMMKYCEQQRQYHIMITLPAIPVVWRILQSIQMYLMPPSELRHPFPHLWNALRYVWILLTYLTDTIVRGFALNSWQPDPQSSLHRFALSVYFCVNSLNGFILFVWVCIVDFGFLPLELMPNTPQTREQLEADRPAPLRTHHGVQNRAKHSGGLFRSAWLPWANRSTSKPKSFWRRIGKALRSPRKTCRLSSWTWRPILFQKRIYIAVTFAIFLTCWIWLMQYLIATNVGKESNRWLPLLITSCHIFYRMIWMMIRLENDMVNNIELYKVTQTAPPPIVKPKRSTKRYVQTNPYAEAELLDTFWEHCSAPLLISSEKLQSTSSADPTSQYQKLSGMDHFFCLLPASEQRELIQLLAATRQEQMIYHQQHQHCGRSKATFTHQEFVEWFLSQSIEAKTCALLGRIQKGCSLYQYTENLVKTE